MSTNTIRKNERKLRRQRHVRSRLRRESTRVRLSIFRSSKHIYAQLIDDSAGRTLAQVGSSAKALAGELDGKKKCEKAAIVGREIAKLAKDQGVETVVFDRGYSKFHGRVKALADAAREGGLKF